MTEQEEANITKNEQDSQMFRPHLRKAKKFVLGSEPPRLYTQIVFFAGVLITFIFGIWNTLSYFILKSPLYLKRHKQVDVEAIISLRGRELGFEANQFYRYLETFHFTGIIIWFCILIALIFLWRQKKWSAYIIIGGMVIYSALMAFMLGATYFIEDTTLFDKLALLILLILVLIHHFVAGTKDPEIVEVEKEELIEEEDQDS